MRARTIPAVLLTVLAMLAGPAALEAQYFGRNKVQYRSFAFEILKTDHFDLYHYPEEKEAARLVARMAERWHARLSRFFSHQLRGRQPIILYAAASHFRSRPPCEVRMGQAP